MQNLTRFLRLQISTAAYVTTLCAMTSPRPSPSLIFQLFYRSCCTPSILLRIGPLSHLLQAGSELIAIFLPYPLTHSDHIPNPFQLPALYKSYSVGLVVPLLQLRVMSAFPFSTGWVCDGSIHISKNFLQRLALCRDLAPI